MARYGVPWHWKESDVFDNSLESNTYCAVLSWTQSCAMDTIMCNGGRYNLLQIFPGRVQQADQEAGRSDRRGRLPVRTRPPSTSRRSRPRSGATSSTPRPTSTPRISRASGARRTTRFQAKLVHIVSSNIPHSPIAAIIIPPHPP